MWLTLVRKGSRNLHEPASPIKGGKVMINKYIIFFLLLSGIFGAAKAEATRHWLGPVDIKRIYLGGYRVDLVIDQSKTPLPCKLWTFPTLNNLIYFGYSEGVPGSRPDTMLAVLLAGQSQSADVMIEVFCAWSNGLPTGYLDKQIYSVRLIN